MAIAGPVNPAQAARRWPCVIDTNVLIRSLSTLPEEQAERQEAERAINGLIYRGNRLFTLPIILMEFWRVSRRSVNGLGLSPEQVRAEMVRIEAFAPCLPDAPEVLVEWRSLIHAHDVPPAQAYDVYIAATLRAHPSLRGARDPRLLTFNGNDFTHYAGEGIFRVVHPAGVDGPPTLA